MQIRIILPLYWRQEYVKQTIFGGMIFVGKSAIIFRRKQKHDNKKNEEKNNIAHTRK